MHSTSIIVESMSAMRRRRRRSASGWTTTSTWSSAPSSAIRAASSPWLNSRSQAFSPSIQLRAKAWAPTIAMRSSAAEISPPASRSFAISVAMNIGDLPALALIAGPTASGKSDLAVALAGAEGGCVIVNADSAQVYRDLQVVSARPSEDEVARIPHRRFGIRDGADPCSAADWAAEAKAAIAEVQDAGQLPILVGGTGLYLRTLL